MLNLENDSTVRYTFAFMWHIPENHLLILILKCDAILIMQMVDVISIILQLQYGAAASKDA